MVSISERVRAAGIESKQLTARPNDEKLDLLSSLIATDMAVDAQALQPPHVDDYVKEWLSEASLRLSGTITKRLVELVLRRVFGYGILSELLEDPEVSDIWVNHYDDIWVERNGEREKVRSAFGSISELWTVLDRLASECRGSVTRENPILDTRMPDNGPRLTITVPPVTPQGPTLTVRKYAPAMLSLEDLTRRGAMSVQMAVFLISAVRAGLNIVVSGGTGSGKTTLLSALMTYIPADERLITIEDTLELSVPTGRNVVPLEANATSGELMQDQMSELLRRSLRMSPDRIIVGEVRGPEAATMLQAMNTGHDGSMCSIHANSPDDAISRLETLVLMARFDLPYEAIKKQIGSAVHILVQQSRLSDGRRLITEISEIVAAPHLTVAPIFTYVPDVDMFVATGLRPTTWHRRQSQFLPANATDPFAGIEEISLENMLEE